MLQRGFTLIELLVVIAIIGILAAVVLTSLGGAQTGAIDSNIQQGMAGIPAQAQLYYNNNNFSYTGVCGATDGSDAGTIYETLNNIASGAGQLELTDAACQDDTTSWAASFDLQSDGADFWCVDSDGARQEQDDAVTGTSCD